MVSSERRAPVPGVFGDKVCAVEVVKQVVIMEDDTPKRQEGLDGKERDAGVLPLTLNTVRRVIRLLAFERAFHWRRAGDAHRLPEIQFAWFTARS